MSLRSLLGPALALLAAASQVGAQAVKQTHAAAANEIAEAKPESLGSPLNVSQGSTAR